MAAPATAYNQIQPFSPSFTRQTGPCQPMPNNTPTPAAGAYGRPGAPMKNRNGMRHGLRSGALPRGAAYVKREVDEMRVAIEDAVMARKGAIDIFDAATIQSAMRWERHALLAQRWLRQSCETMTPDQRLAYSREIARASSARDRCLERLGLDRRSLGDTLDALYGEMPDNAPDLPPAAP